jgi:hypothetical protein
MTYSIRTKGNTHTLEAVEGKVACTLTLAKTHDITTKGDDVDGLADRISRSYRNCVGKNVTGKEFLKLIKQDLAEGSIKPKKVS